MGQAAEKITKTALTLTKHAKRKKVTKDDILLAIKYFK
ncbi:MAG: histone-like protein [Promethearchaeota archaeon]